MVFESLSIHFGLHHQAETANVSRSTDAWREGRMDELLMSPLCRMFHLRGRCGLTNEDGSTHHETQLAFLVGAWR